MSHVKASAVAGSITEQFISRQRISKSRYKWVREPIKYKCASYAAEFIKLIVLVTVSPLLAQQQAQLPIPQLHLILFHGIFSYTKEVYSRTSIWRFFFVYL